MTTIVTLIVTIPVASASDIEARIVYMCRDIPGVSVTVQQPEEVVLANVAHRGDNEKVEAMLCEGLYENATKASQLGLPLVTKPYSSSNTTGDFGTCDSLDAFLGKPLRNTVHGNLGADIVVLTQDAAGPTEAGHFSLHLIQLKRGKTTLGYPKSTCGPTNKGRSVYYIHKGLVDIGTELVTLLTERSAGDVKRVTPHYYLMTTADVRPESKAFLDKRGVTIVSGVAALVPLMPARIKDAAQRFL